MLALKQICADNSAAFFVGVAANKGLRELDVSWNAHAKGGVRSIADALRSSAVERMILSQVPIHPSQIYALDLAVNL